MKEYVYGEHEIERLPITEPAKTVKEFKKLLTAQPPQVQDKIIYWTTPPPYLAFLLTNKQLSSNDFYAMHFATRNPKIAPESLALLYKYSLQSTEPNLALQIVSHPKTPVETLEQAVRLWTQNVWLAKKGFTEYVSAVALANPTLPNPLQLFEETLKETLANSSTKNKFLNEDKYIEDLTSPSVNTHPTVLHRIAEITTPKTNTYAQYFRSIPHRILLHPNCPQETIDLIFNEPVKAEQNNYSWQTRQFMEEVLRNPKCPPLVLQKACWSSNPRFRELASTHPNCPQEAAVAAALMKLNKKD